MNAEAAQVEESLAESTTGLIRRLQREHTDELARAVGVGERMARELDEAQAQVAQLSSKLELAKTKKLEAEMDAQRLLRELAAEKRLTEQLQRSQDELMRREREARDPSESLKAFEEAHVALCRAEPDHHAIDQCRCNTALKWRGLKAALERRSS